MTPLSPFDLMDLTDKTWATTDLALQTQAPEDHLLAAQRHLEAMALVSDPIRHDRFRRYAMAHAAAAMASSREMRIRTFVGWLEGLVRAD